MALCIVDSSSEDAIESFKVIPIINREKETITRECYNTRNLKNPLQVFELSNTNKREKEHKFEEHANQYMLGLLPR